MITDYIGGEGSAETPKNDYVIYGCPLTGLQLMKVKQIKERDCYIRGVNTVINAADPSTIPLLVSGTQRTTSVPALRIIPPPRFDSHSQSSN